MKQVEQATKSYSNTRYWLVIGRLVTIAGMFVFGFQKRIMWFIIAMTFFVILSFIVNAGEKLLVLKKHSDMYSGLQTTDEHLKEIGRRI